MLAVIGFLVLGCLSLFAILSLLIVATEKLDQQGNEHSHQSD